MCHINQYSKCYPFTTETFRYSHHYSLLETTSDLTTVGGRIKYFRLLKGLKQKDIYNKIGIDKSTYIRYESSTTPNHDLEVCRKKCETIGVDAELVFDDYMTFIVSNFGTNIREFRKEHKLTHGKFGALINMHPKISSRWEKGRSIPTRESYEKIINLFRK